MNRREMIGGTFSALALLAAGCGGGSSPLGPGGEEGEVREGGGGFETVLPWFPQDEKDPAPRWFLDQVAPVARRPRIGQGFRVKLLGSGFDRDYIRGELNIVTVMAANMVHFGFVGPEDAAEISILIDPGSPAVQSPKGGVYAGTTLLRWEGGRILGASMVFSERKWLEKPGFLLHEFGHVLGFYHVQPGLGAGRFVMAEEGSPDLLGYHDWERQAWRKLASQQANATRNESAGINFGKGAVCHLLKE